MQSQARKIFVYNLSSVTDVVGQKQTKLTAEKWVPSITKLIPPNSSISYFLFWFAHYLRLFKNRDYCAFIIYQEDQPVCSLVCIPALYRWSFMNPDDLQVKNVFTSKEYRGRGFAFSLVKEVIQRMNKKGRSFWYMTHEHNIPSQKLCKKVGFKYLGEYTRARNKLFLYQGEIVHNKCNL